MILKYKRPAVQAGVLMVAPTAEIWNEIVTDLKAWAVFARDLREASIAV